MSISQDFESSIGEEYEQLDEVKMFSVRKHLDNPKELLEKVLFASFKIDQFFPQNFMPLPEIMKPDTAQKDNNNMDLIEESSFRHDLLKKNVLGFLANPQAPQRNIPKKTLPSMSDYYSTKTPVYEKYKPNPKSKCIATYIIDSKNMLKQDKNKNSAGIFSHSRFNSTVATHRAKIEFGSNFESGNLFQVYQVEYNEFDLILQNDVNSKGNNQWFFFMVKNVPKGLTLKFNIVNFTKKHSLFDDGMKPYTFSMNRHEKRKVGWVREGSKVIYEENEKFGREYENKAYFKLSFEYRFTYDGDVVYFAHSIPYTVTDLANFITTHIQNPSNTNLIKLKDLNTTLGGQQLDIFEITNWNLKVNKKIVWIIARQHPGEITASFMMEGVINFLLGKTKKANELLDHFVFKIVPMVNTDGVIHGNTRSELNGVDPNRTWTHPHKLRNPIIWALKKYIQRDGQKVEMFLDLHSHSRKLGTFFYGNSFKEDKLSTRKYPWMVCNNDERFTHEFNRFSQCNLKSARHVIFEDLQIPLVYTVESSFYGYEKKNNKIIEYLPKDYREMGEELISTFWSYTFEKHEPINTNVTTALDVDEKESIGSNSDAGEDEFGETELKKLLPNLYGIQRSKLKKVKSIKSKQISNQKKINKEEILSLPKYKHNDKESHYKIYFSANNQPKTKKILRTNSKNQLPIFIETRDQAVQACASESLVLKGSVNMSVPISSLLGCHEKRSSLCVTGQKMEEEVVAFGNNVYLQVEMGKEFMQNKEESRKSSARKGFKVTSRINSILQAKENNFLNRADCHVLPTRNSVHRI